MTHLKSLNYESIKLMGSPKFLATKFTFTFTMTLELSTQTLRNSQQTWSPNIWNLNVNGMYKFFLLALSDGHPGEGKSVFTPYGYHSWRNKRSSGLWSLLGCSMGLLLLICLHGKSHISFSPPHSLLSKLWLVGLKEQLGDCKTSKILITPLVLAAAFPKNETS